MHKIIRYFLPFSFFYRIARVFTLIPYLCNISYGLYDAPAM